MEFVLAFIIGLGFGIFIEFALNRLKDEIKHECKPKAIFHMSSLDYGTTSWMEFEDDPTFFENGEEISVIIKFDGGNQND